MTGGLEFLSVEDVIEAHADTLEAEGGLDGIRDHGLLVSAVMTPQQAFGGQYLHEDVPAMAAAYAFHLVRNHPFLDGNKRVGLAAAYTFLRCNGHDLVAPDEEMIATIRAVAEGSLDKAALTQWFRDCTRPARGGETTGANAVGSGEPGSTSGRTRTRRPDSREDGDGAGRCW